MIDEAKKKSMIARIAQAMAEQQPPRENLKDRFMIRKYQAKRLRFVSDMDQAIPVRMHWAWSRLYATSCHTQLGRPCPYCGDPAYRTGEWYALTVWDLDEKDLKVLAGGTSSWSPIPEILRRFEERGTLVDRVYRIKKRTLRRQIVWDVVPEGGRCVWDRHFTPFSAQQVYEALNTTLKPKTLIANGLP